MAGKSDYKKLGSEWGRKARKNEDLRAKTAKTALENAADSGSKHKKKAIKKKTVRSDHKHLYKELVLVKFGTHYMFRKRCTICGKLREEKFNSTLNRMSNETKVVFENGIQRVRYLTAEELMAKYGEVPLVVYDESTT